jgi:O-acetyl-ADP-ribose deacetylase (regulator of RNase III)
MASWVRSADCGPDFFHQPFDGPSPDATIGGGGVMSETIAMHTLAANCLLRLIHGDITQVHCDAIVNAANSHLAHAGGLAAAIVRRGGDSIQRQSDEWVRQHGLVDHAHPAITGAGRLPCRYILHAVGPVWGSGDEAGKLQAAVAGSMAQADELGLHSLALPAISTGIFGYPADQAAETMLTAIDSYMASHPASSLQAINLVMVDERTLRAFADAFNARWPESSLK